MTDVPAPLEITPMQRRDVPRVHELEKICFSAPWDLNAYYSELRNPTAHYLVARLDGLLVGFGGMWVVSEEAHIVTLAVDPAYRRRGIANQLLTDLLTLARMLGVQVITLEVRVSNYAAQALYTAHGFTITNYRRRYYPDNQEDAAVMRAVLTEG